MSSFAQTMLLLALVVLSSPALGSRFDLHKWKEVKRNLGLGKVQAADGKALKGQPSLMYSKKKEETPAAEGEGSPGGGAVRQGNVAARMAQFDALHKKVRPDAAAEAAQQQGFQPRLRASSRAAELRAEASTHAAAAAAASLRAEQAAAGAATLRAEVARLAAQDSAEQAHPDAIAKAKRTAEAAREAALLSTRTKKQQVRLDAEEALKDKRAAAEAVRLRALIAALDPDAGLYPKAQERIAEIAAKAADASSPHNSPPQKRLKAVREATTSASGAEDHGEPSAPDAEPPATPEAEDTVMPEAPLATPAAEDTVMPEAPLATPEAEDPALAAEMATLEAEFEQRKSEVETDFEQRRVSLGSGAEAPVPGAEAVEAKAPSSPVAEEEAAAKDAEDAATAAAAAPAAKRPWEDKLKDGMKGFTGYLKLTGSGHLEFKWSQTFPEMLNSGIQVWATVTPGAELALWALWKLGRTEHINGPTGKHDPTEVSMFFKLARTIGVMVTFLEPAFKVNDIVLYRECVDAQGSCEKGAEFVEQGKSFNIGNVDIVGIMPPKDAGSDDGIARGKEFGDCTTKEKFYTAMKGLRDSDYLALEGHNNLGGVEPMKKQKRLGGGDPKNVPVAPTRPAPVAEEMMKPKPTVAKEAQETMKPEPTVAKEEQKMTKPEPTVAKDGTNSGGKGCYLFASFHKPDTGDAGSMSYDLVKKWSTEHVPGAFAYFKPLKEVPSWNYDPGPGTKLHKVRSLKIDSEYYNKWVSFLSSANKAKGTLTLFPFEQVAQEMPDFVPEVTKKTFATKVLLMPNKNGLAAPEGQQIELYDKTEGHPPAYSLVAVIDAAKENDFKGGMSERDFSTALQALVRNGHASLPVEWKK